MFKKIKKISQFLKIVKKIENLKKENQKDFEELFESAQAKIKKVSPEIAEILADIKELLK